MRVVIHDPYLDTLGGGEKYVLAVASYFLKKKCSVDIIFNQKIEKSLLVERFRLPIKKINIVNIDINKLSIIGKYLFFRKYDYSFIVSDGSVPLPFSGKNFLHFQVPFNKQKVSFLDKLKLKLFDTVVVNSSFTKKIIDKTYSINSAILFPPVTIFKKSNKKNLIISIGRFNAQLNSKRQDVLIEAFKIFSKTNKYFRLALIGGISKKETLYLNKLRFQAKGYKIDFYPNLSMPEMSKLISQSLLYWHAAGFGCNESDPESFEHFGISILEAASAGSVPLVYNGGGPKEFIIEGQNGYFYTDVSELAAKSSALMKNKNILDKLSKQAHITAREYSLEEFYSNAQEIFK